MNILSNLLSRAVPTITAPAEPINPPAERINSLSMSRVTTLVREAHDRPDFSPTIADMMLVAELSAQHYNEPMGKIIRECVRVDTKTGALTTSGHVAFDTEYYANEADALAAVQAEGYPTLADAYDDGQNECVCYWTDWNDYHTSKGTL